MRSLSEGARIGLAFKGGFDGVEIRGEGKAPEGGVDVVSWVRAGCVDRLGRPRLQKHT